MKHKLLLVLLTALIPCLFMQGCISNFEEDNTELSEEDRVAEMFREAGFKVEKLSSKPVNPPMTEKEASLFLAAYKNRERSGSIQIPSENIELKPDGHLVVKVKCNSEKKNFSRTRTVYKEEFDFTHWATYTVRDIEIECWQDIAGYWKSDNVNCTFTTRDPEYICGFPDINPNTGYSKGSLYFSINITVSRYSGWQIYSVDENYDYTLMLTWLPVAQEWNASLSWHETFGNMTCIITSLMKELKRLYSI